MAARVTPSECAAILHALRRASQRRVARAFRRSPTTISLIALGLHACQRGRNLYPRQRRRGGEGERGRFQSPIPNPQSPSALAHAGCGSCGARGVMPCLDRASLRRLAALVRQTLDGPLGLELKPAHRARYLQVRARREMMGEGPGAWTNDQ